MFTSKTTLRFALSELLRGWHAKDISFLLGHSGSTTPEVYAKAYHTENGNLAVNQLRIGLHDRSL